MARLYKDSELSRQNHRVSVALTDAAYEALHAEAKAAGVSLSEYIRNILNSRRIILHNDIVLDSSAVVDVTRALSRIGNNLNQIARWYNTWKIPDDTIEQELRHLLDKFVQISIELTELSGGVKRGRR